jgi:hypothetical protein
MFALMVLAVQSSYMLDAHIFDALLRRIDINSDGRLTFDELREHLETEHTCVRFSHALMTAK